MDTNKTIYHICNGNTPEPEGVPGWKNIDSEEKLLELDRDVEEDKQRIFIINVHLNWRRPYGSDYGFEVARKIRVEMQSIAPIVFYSPIPVKYFERATEVKKYRLLYGRGSGFITAPFTEEALDEAIAGIPALSRAALRDVQFTLCDLKGLILAELDHGLRFGYNPNNCLEEIALLMDPVQRSLVDFETKKNELLNTYANDKERFSKARGDLIDTCRSELVGDEIPASDVPDGAGYKLLLLEDDERWSRTLEEFLEIRFAVEVTADAEDAIKRLRNDRQTEITAVICDWRLKRPNSRYWQQKAQGYEVLQVARETGTRALFALTSVEDQLVHNIRNEMDLQFHLVKKESLQTEGQKALFSDVIFEHCQNAVSNRFVSQSETWNRDYKPLYMRLQESSVRWKDFLLRVEGIADFCWQKIDAEHKAKIDLKAKFGLSATTKGTPNLDNIFVLRLIWFGIWFKEMYREEMESEEITHKLKNLYLRTTSANDDKRYGTELNKLGFRQDDLLIHLQTGLPNVLPHEHEWLTDKGFLPRLPAAVPEASSGPDQIKFSSEEEAEREGLQQMLRGCANYDEAVEKMGKARWDRYQALINKKSRFDEQQKRNAEFRKLREGLSNLRK